MVVQSQTTRLPLLTRVSSVCTSCANSSFPVPLSPVIKTEESVKVATSTICLSTRIHAALRPARFSFTRGDSTIVSTCFQRWDLAEISCAGLRHLAHAKTSAAPAASKFQITFGSSARRESEIANTRSTPARLSSLNKSSRRSENSLKNTMPGPLRPKDLWSLERRPAWFSDSINWR